MPATIREFKALTNMPDHENASALLKRLVAVTTKVMMKRQWEVGVLREFYPSNQGLYGLNVNRGQSISIRLRDPNNSKIFLEWHHIIGTMCHELAHNQISSHSADFYKLMDELLDEVESDYSSSGSSFKSGSTAVSASSVNVIPFSGPGHKLGGFSVSRNGVRDAACSAAIKRMQYNHDQVYKLGGSAPAGHDRRAIAAAAAEKRMKMANGMQGDRLDDTFICGDCVPPQPATLSSSSSSSSSTSTGTKLLTKSKHDPTDKSPSNHPIRTIGDYFQRMSTSGDSNLSGSGGSASARAETIAAVQPWTCNICYEVNGLSEQHVVPLCCGFCGCSFDEHQLNSLGPPSSGQPTEAPSNVEVRVGANSSGSTNNDNIWTCGLCYEVNAASMNTVVANDLRSCGFCGAVTAREMSSASKVSAPAASTRKWVCHVCLEENESASCRFCGTTRHSAASAATTMPQRRQAESTLIDMTSNSDDARAAPTSVRSAPSSSSGTKKTDIIYID